MGSLRSAYTAVSAAVVVWCCTSLTASPAQAGFGGQLEYTGTLGPIGQHRPLCICFFTNPELTTGPGCFKFTTNPVRYNLNYNTGQYYLRAFVDIHVNDRYDTDEPFQIYRERAAPPGDPVSAQSGDMNIDFTFGDENLPGAPTPTSTESPTPTPSPPPSPTPTPPSTPAAVACDCDGNGSVSIDELVRGVAIALHALDTRYCPPADLNRDGLVHVDELIRAVSAALGHIR